MEGVQQLFQKVYELSDTDARKFREAERVGRENVHKVDVGGKGGNREDSLGPNYGTRI